MTPADSHAPCAPLLMVLFIQAFKKPQPVQVFTMLQKVKYFPLRRCQVVPGHNPVPLAVDTNKSLA